MTELKGDESYSHSRLHQPYFFIPSPFYRFTHPQETVAPSSEVCGSRDVTDRSSVPTPLADRCAAIPSLKHNNSRSPLIPLKKGEAVGRGINQRKL